MRLDRVEEAIERCREHLETTNAKGTEIETFLTSYLLVIICSGYEERIADMLEKRASAAIDAHIEAFFRATASRYTKRIKTSDLRETIGYFGEDLESAFLSRITQSEAETRYNNIITNRNLVAHESGVNMTFDELRESYSKATDVLDTVSDILAESAKKDHP